MDWELIGQLWAILLLGALAFLIYKNLYSLIESKIRGKE